MQPLIGYLLKKFPRLSETFILGELLQQEALGAQLRVFSRRTPDDEPRHPALEGMKAEVELLPSRSELDPWSRVFAPEEAGLLEALGPVVRPLQEFGLPRIGRLVGEALHVLDRTRDLGVQHLHVHFATESAIVAHLVHQLGGPTYSITAHAKDIYRSTVDPRLLTRIVADSSFTTTVCEANLEHLRGFLGEAAQPRLRKLFNGIDLEHFRPGDAPREEDLVLSVGRLVEKKGLDLLVDAMVQVRAARPAARCVIVGQGDAREALEARIQERDAGAFVRLEGALHQGEVLALMQRATVFALPCRVGDDGNRDALPTVLLEALGCGLPCVSTPVTGIPEILDQGRVGRLVPEEDSDALAAALLELLGSSEERQRLSEEGRAHALTHFNGPTIAQTLKAWQEACVTGSQG
jgi:glycosyltransferase involved in cell wall biosynthesis